MSIIFNEKQQAFYLSTPNTSYVMALTHESNILNHVYWGVKVNETESLEEYITAVGGAFSAQEAEYGGELSTDGILAEFAYDGSCDLRTPAFKAVKDGFDMLVSPKVQAWRIISGKPELEGLPHTYTESDDEADTLEISIEDESGIRVKLYYTVFANYDAITRHAVIENIGDAPFSIKKALSMSVDFEDTDFEFMHLHGAWARERHIERRPLLHGIQSVGSTRGSSSHMHSPFMALVRPQTTERIGDAYGFSLVYSGNFIAGADVSHKEMVRAFMGINPDRFSWLLAPGESFTTPEVVMVYSNEGIGKMSLTYNELYRERLCRGYWRDKARPVLINNWEGTYFDFTEEKILDIARQGKEMGCELMVLDDGWFGKRDDDNCSLGDWVEHEGKLPDGIESLADKVCDMGLKFGLWFEPEMVSPDSDLHRTHPDWHIHIPGRPASQGRRQWILDLSRKDVQDYVIEAVSAILSKAKISYVKWDMNRNMAELGSAALEAERMGELTHRYMLGLYRVMEELVTRFPEVLFEGCSGGGGRFDAGFIYYMPQFWTSDCSDAVERIKIQYGTGIVFPAITMGAHVSAIPNHQTGRSSSLKMRGDVASMGQFGYELDPASLTQDEKDEIKEQIKFYKSIREVIQFGKSYRLVSPFEGNIAAWNFVSKDENTVVFCSYNILTRVSQTGKWIKLCGLEKDAIYKEETTGKLYSGDMLMNKGIRKCFTSDFSSDIQVFKKVK